MGLILDTSILIAAERKRLDLAGLFAKYPAESYYLSSITAAELLHGVSRAQSPERKKVRSMFVESILAAIEVIDFDLEVARRHAELWASLKGSGKIIGPYDLLNAATALHYDHGVVTLNVAEFRHVAGLRLIDITPFLLT